MSTLKHLDEIIASVEAYILENGGDPTASSKQTNPKKKTKKEKNPKPTAAVAEQSAISKLDIRVGRIRKVWKHETADKLYCEEIDVGEDAPRNIASGLFYHYSLEEMQDRRVLVLCNLKARNLVGFRSHGMVLCAAKKNEDGSEKVAFVEPPVDAKIGERVLFKDQEGEPFSPAQVEKKKVLDAVCPDMKTDANGVALWKEIEFMTTAGPCICTSVPSGDIR